MLRAVKEISQVKGGHVTVVILINLVPGLIDPSLSVGIWLSTDSEEELIEVDSSILISVEEIEKDLSLTLGNGDTVVLEAEVKLLLVELAGAVGEADHSEGSRDSSQLSNALCCDRLLNLSEDFR